MNGIQDVYLKDAGEMNDDESRVGDRVFCEEGCLLRQPHFNGAGHSASSADSRLPMIAVLLRDLNRSHFLFDQCRWCHRTGSSTI